MASALDGRGAPAAERRSRAQFAEVYDQWFDQVVRWLPAMGGRPSEVEDLAQEIFVIAERKIEGFAGESLGAWLYAIAVRVVRNHRRLAWFRAVVFKPASDPTFERGPAGASPEEGLERKQLAALATRALGAMSDKHRRAFVLFEIEELSGQEIAELEGIPLATVWTRIHHARKELVARTQALREHEGIK
jgi:RNA polymerase sigma-70 factor (ECF subfamily)